MNIHGLHDNAGHILHSLFYLFLNVPGNVRNLMSVFHDNVQVYHGSVLVHKNLYALSGVSSSQNLNNITCKECNLCNTGIFAEFNNLRRNNLPAQWDDDIGGAFQLLTRFKYNEIDKYLKFNVRYDAPLILVPSIFRRVKYITREKLYCNLLFVDTMDPYIEMGYGIGTNIFNVGVFWGGEITKWDTIGVKFTFEIFND